MRNHKKHQSFLQTTLIGGLGAVLPTVLLIILFQWIIRLIQGYLEPLVKLFGIDSKIWNTLLYFLAVLAILMLFFIIGVIIQTRLGNRIRNLLERVFLMKIPGYKTIKDVVMQFIDSRSSFFKEVVLVDVFGTGTLMTGFVTDREGEYLTVFVPTGPNPTSGNIMHVHQNRVIPSSVPVETALKSILGVGAGSKEIFDFSDQEALQKHLLNRDEK